MPTPNGEMYLGVGLACAAIVPVSYDPGRRPQRGPGELALKATTKHAQAHVSR